MRCRALIAVAVVLGLLALGGIAWASIPGPDGVIHGCYKTSNPAKGSVIVIDHTASCPSGFAPLNWNQTGPAGPQGPPGSVAAIGWETVQEETGTSGGVVGTSPDCGSGKFAVSGGWQFKADDGSSRGAIEVIQDRPESLAPTLSSTWIVQILVDTPGLLRAWVICAYRPV
jgi:hypothetical protein